MRTFIASLLFSSLLFGAAPASAQTSNCDSPVSPLAMFDAAPDVVRVRVVPGSEEVAIGGVSYKVVVLEVLRGSTKVGATLEASSGGPCARRLAEKGEYVLAFGRSDTVGVSRLAAGTIGTLPTSVALQTALAKTKADDVRGRAALIYKAANAKTVTKDDRLSMLAYLVQVPDVTRALTPAQQRRLDTLFADGKKAQPELAAAWTKLITK